MKPFQAFVNFQLRHCGALMAEDAAEIAGVSRATIYTWAERGTVKSFVHRGKFFVGKQSLGDWLSVYGYVVEGEKRRRLRVAKRHKRRESANAKLTIRKR